MVIGKFHDPVTGRTFMETIQDGEYEVVHEGRTLEYTTTPGNAKSQCTCPICGKVFDVDLNIPVVEATPIEDVPIDENPDNPIEEDPKDPTEENPVPIEEDLP